MLYKYLPPERFDVIRDARIRFTQPSNLNDPFELKPFFKTPLNPHTLPARIRERMDLRPALLEKYKTMPLEVRLCLSEEQFVQFCLAETARRQDEFDAIFQIEMNAFLAELPKLGDKFRELIHKHFGEEIGILSLSEDPLSDLMWAHYAKDHSGFVIGLDETHQFFNQRRSSNDEFFHLRKVCYLDNPLNAESLEELIDSDLFASKLSTWSHEREWRMLIPLTGRIPEIKTDKDSIHLLAIPKAVIQSVIVGMRSDQAVRENLRAILASDSSYSHVRIQEEFLDLERGCLEIRDAN